MRNAELLKLESFEQPEEEFADMLLEALHIHTQEASVEIIDDTCEIDTDMFTLSFTVSNTTFEIRNIEVSEKGIGHKLINIIHEYADKKDFQVIASSVKSTAIGFWRRMGYEEGEDGTFMRI